MTKTLMLSAVLLTVLVATIGIIPAYADLNRPVNDDCGGKTVHVRIFQRDYDNKLDAYILAPWTVDECGGIFSKPAISLDTITLEITEASGNVCYHKLYNNRNTLIDPCPLVDGPETFQYRLVLEYSSIWRWHTYPFHSSFTVQ